MLFRPLSALIPSSFLALALFASAAQAQTTYYVDGGCGSDGWSGARRMCEAPDGPMKTIQAAIDAASSGDTVRICEGIYTGVGNTNLTLRGKAIRLQGSGGAANVIIDCEGRGPGLIFDSGEGPGTVVEEITIINGRADRGAAVALYGSSPTFRGCVFRYNGSDDDYGTFGGAIYGENTDAVFEDCNFTDNQAWQGGGAYLLNSDPQFTNCYFTWNLAHDSGGGLYLNRSDAVLDSCRIISNACDQEGGGIYGVDSSPTLTTCDIDENVGPRAAAAHLFGGFVTFDRCSFRANESYQSTVYGFMSWMEFYTPEFSGNQTQWSGYAAAISTRNSGLFVWGGRFADNSGNAVIRTWYGYGTVHEVTMERNDVEVAIWSEVSGDYFSDCLVRDNSGSGAYLFDGQSSLYGCTIENNGGAGVIAESGAKISGCTIRGNEGLGLSLDDASISDSVIVDNGEWEPIRIRDSEVVRCLFRGNSVEISTPEMILIGDVLIANSLVVDYHWEWSGDYIIEVREDSDVSIQQCTIIDSGDGPSEGAIHVVGDSQVEILGSIIWANGRRQFGGDGIQNIEISYSNIRDGFAGIGNIEMDPLFVDAAAEDYRLAPGSPCIDAADAWSFSGMSEDIDLDGATRFHDDLGVPDTGVDPWGYTYLDIGAYEFQGTTESFILVRPIPGDAGEVNTIQAANAQPFERVYYLWGSELGSMPVPGCPGLVIDLKSPALIVWAESDETGYAALETNVPSSFAGRKMYFQAIDRSTCNVSNLVTWQFP